MGDDSATSTPEVPGRTTDVLGRSTEVNAVEAARDWLRRHGVDPGSEAQAVPQHAGAGREVRLASASVSVSVSAEAEAEAEAERPAARRRARQRHVSEAGADGLGADDDGAWKRGGSAAADPDADPEEVARQIVLRKLAVRACTRAELERALKARAVPEEAGAVVLARMAEVGLVDDATFARDWVSSRQQRRHLSRTALRRELQTKGVDRDVIDDALAEVEGVDEHRAALDLAQRRASAMAGLSREVAYRRLGGVLARRGFSASTTARVLAQVLGNRVDDGTTG